MLVIRVGEGIEVQRRVCLLCMGVCVCVCVCVFVCGAEQAPPFVVVVGVLFVAIATPVAVAVAGVAEDEVVVEVQLGWC